MSFLTPDAMSKAQTDGDETNSAEATSLLDEIKQDCYNDLYSDKLLINDVDDMMSEIGREFTSALTIKRAEDSRDELRNRDESVNTDMWGGHIEPSERRRRL